jgi:exosortase/archaeosortase family protein
MRSVTQLRENISLSSRALLGYCYLGFGLVAYLLFQDIRATSLALATGLVFVGIASLFLAYRYLSTEYETLLRYKELLYFFVTPVLAFYFLITIGFDKFILETEFGKAWLGNVMYFSRSFMSVIGPPFTGVGNEIILDAPDSLVPVTLLVTEACSGIHSSFLFLAFFGMMLVDLRKRMNRKTGAMYLAIGAIGTYSANIVRIVVLSLITYYIGFGAMKTFHDYFGFVFFIGWIFAFWFFVYHRVRGEGPIAPAAPAG